LRRRAPSRAAGYAESVPGCRERARRRLTVAQVDRDRAREARAREAAVQLPGDRRRARRLAAATRELVRACAVGHEEGAVGGRHQMQPEALPVPAVVAASLLDRRGPLGRGIRAAERIAAQIHVEAERAAVLERPAAERQGPAGAEGLVRPAAGPGPGDLPGREG